MALATDSTEQNLAPYVPQIARAWLGDSPESRYKSVEGTLLFSDVSGFTELSEKLGAKGKVGAEELTLILDRVFSEMLEVVHRRGGQLLKFGGDALLVIFNGRDHVIQACAAAVEMRAVLRSASAEPTSAGRINLRMSSGIASGEIDLYLVGTSHRELVVLGDVATSATEMESAAGPGEIALDLKSVESLPAGFAGDPIGDGRLLRKRTIHLGSDSDAAHPEVGEVEILVPMGLRQALSGHRIEPEHRQANVGFVSFRGAAAISESDGPPAIVSELEALIAAAQEACDRDGVTFLATDVDADGGKLILVSGVPASQQDDEGRLLRTLRAIVDNPNRFEVKAGANRGHVFAGEIGTDDRRTFTVMGDTVNVAARLMSAAKPGGLISSPAVLNMSSTLFDTVQLEPLSLKGKKMAVAAYQVGNTIGTRPPDFDRHLPFHGREAELQMLVSIVSTCAMEGAGGSITVTGDTGMGKTRLVSEVLERCDGFHELLIQAEPAGLDIPYWAFRDPMRRLLKIERGPQPQMVKALTRAIDETSPDLDWATPLIGDVLHIEVPDNDRTAALDPQFRPERTADAFIDFLEARVGGPLVIVVEDAHWLDEVSMNLVRRLSSGAVGRNWAVVITARPESGNFEPIGSEVVLSPLADEATRAIAIEASSAAPLRPHVLDGVVSRVAGNPLFLSETLRVVAGTGEVSDLPESLDAVVSSDIDSLPALSRRVLRYVSVLGRSFRRVVANQLLEPEDLELDRATLNDLEMFLEFSDPERLRFRHAVVHDVAYESLSYGRRRDLHARAGAVIEQLAGEDTEAVAEFLAMHFTEAGDHRRGYAYSVMAADNAKAAFANMDAVRQYRRATDNARQLDDTEKSELVDLELRSAEALELAGELEQALTALRRAARSADAAGKMVEIELARAGIWLTLGTASQAKSAITRARKNVARSDDHRELAVRVEALDASVQAASGDPFAALDAATRAAELGKHAGVEDAVARAYTVMDWANFVVGSDAPRVGQEAVDIYRRLGQHERSAVVLNNLGGFAYLEGSWDESHRFYQEAVEAADKSGNHVEAANTKTAIAEVLVGQGKLDEATTLIEQADLVLRSSNADQLLPFVSLQRARALVALGDDSDAIAELRPLIEEQLAGSETPWTGETVVLVADSLVSVGDTTQALELLGRLEQSAPESFDEVHPGTLRVGARASAVSEQAGAVELYESALDGALERGDLYEEYKVLTSWLAELPGQGDSQSMALRVEALEGQLGIVDVVAI